MTSPDDVPLDGPRDGSTDDPAKGTPDGPVEPGLPGSSGDPSFDEEAAWRLIVENYGERPTLGDPASDPYLDPGPGGAPGPVPPGPPVRPADPVPESEAAAPSTRPTERHDLFDRSYLDAVESDDERRDRRHTDGHDHFVPPEPPPIPRGTPARRLAWFGLFAPPVLMILAVVVGWAFPAWLAMLMVAAFVGGFVFLVLTMPRDGEDGRGDGAVV
jgi:hypothetical protein